MILEHQNHLKPSMDLVIRLMARWSCSIMLLRYLDWHNMQYKHRDQLWRFQSRPYCHSTYLQHGRDISIHRRP